MALLSGLAKTYEKDTFVNYKKNTEYTQICLVLIRHTAVMVEVNTMSSQVTKVSVYVCVCVRVRACVCVYGDWLPNYLFT